MTSEAMDEHDAVARQWILGNLRDGAITLL